MTNLDDLLDTTTLQDYIDDGLVRARINPFCPTLTILNYTEKAQYERHWDNTTKQCRGLIFHNITQEVVARPFDKFFNYGEHDYDTSDWADQQVQVTDKMDGSLGILYKGWAGLLAVATRGSFNSTQANHATQVLRRKYLDFDPVPDVTYLFEIIYPENRIVLDYDDRDDLFFLGARHIPSGEIYGPDLADRLGWYGPMTPVLLEDTFTGALGLPLDRKNAEGIVIRFRGMQPNSGLMVKVKQEDYVRLHKLVTGLNERAVWEHLSTHNGTYGELLASVPDEFHQWVTITAEALIDQYEDTEGMAHANYREILDYMRHEGPDSLAWDRDDRKVFASLAQESRFPAALFRLLDGRDLAPYIWRTIKPKGETASLMNRNEDNA